MRLFKMLAAACVGAFLAGCGGGGGDAGTSLYGTGSGTGTGTGTSTTTGAYTISIDVQRAGVSTASISSTETVQVVATVTSSSGTPVQGVVVSYTQSGGPTVTFAPVAATALTDANGTASIDVGASTVSSTGATTLTASASVVSTALTASKSIQIAAGAVTGTVATPAAINFIGSVPSGTAIVIKGAGGNGRSESAVLTFKVVDASNAAINAATVNFALNSSNGGATLLQSSAVSNSDGQVSVIVSSGSTPASILVTATVAGTSISSQSDTLIVSNSVPVAGGFEVVAAKYNLDGRKTGDSTAISAYVRDQFGNPVPDGVAVSFTTDYGAVGSSTLGGCTTANGVCSVNFRVQDPRPTANGIATVTGSVGVGSTTQLVQTLQINMASANGSPYLALTTGGTTVTQLTLNSCVQTVELLLSDGSGHATSAGTTITAPVTSTGVALALTSGTPVLDSLNLAPTLFSFSVDVTAVTAAPCVPGGTVKPSGQFFRFSFTSSGNIVYSQRVDLSYPQ